MTKKPIMIDEIDVSECKFTLERDGKIKCECTHATGFGVICDCESWKTCDYKNYKRKEKECEDLKKKLKPKLKNAHCTYFEGQTGLCRAKEFLKCNPVGCRLYTIDELSTIVDLQQQVDQLKAENDELKTEFDKFEEQIKLQGNFIDSFLFATKNSDWLNKSILEDEADAIIEKVESDYVQLEKYKQVLQEIKQIAEDDCKTCTVKLLGEDEINCRRCYKTKILQKCEVIDG